MFLRHIAEVCQAKSSCSGSSSPQTTRTCCTAALLFWSPNIKESRILRGLCRARPEMRRLQISFTPPPLTQFSPAANRTAVCIICTRLHTRKDQAVPLVSFISNLFLIPQSSTPRCPVQNAALPLLQPHSTGRLQQEPVPENPPVTGTKT